MPPTTIPETDNDTVSPTAASFKIFTGLLKAYEKDGDTRKYLRCTASSTVEDLHGDRMTDECVMDMAPQARAKGMTIFLNHSYKFPEDVFGKTTDAAIVSRASDENGKAIYDLDLEIQLNEANSRALETYAAIKDQGIKAGVSIGAMIEDWDFIDEEAGFWGGLEIKQVNLLEASIVGIPANQRSWVVNALKALGAPRMVIRKALGEEFVPPLPPLPESLTAATATNNLIVNTTTGNVATNGTITVLTVGDPEPTDDDSAAPDEETPDEDAAPESDESEKALATLADAEDALDSIKAAGADSGLLDIVLGFLEGATEEVASLRKALEDVTKERDKLLADVLAAAEIVETLARTPIGRKAHFVAPVTSFRQKFGGIYDEGFLKVLEGVDDDDE